MEHRLKTIAVDDEFRALEVIERYVTKVPFLEMVQTFTNPIAALAFLENTPVDLIFLDINMPDLSGTSLAKLISGKVQVIFTTAYSEFAVEGFELDATDYLLKPIDFERFLKASLKAKSKAEQPIAKESALNQKRNILINTSGKIFQITIDEFLYAEKLGNDMFLHLPGNRKLQCRISIKELLDQLPDGFCQVHKSFVVSLSKIDQLEKNQLSINDYKIPIGRTFRQHLLDQLKRH